MEWTIIGDPHAKPDNLEKIGTLFDIAEELGNPALILGDLLDTKEVVRSRVFNYVMSRLKASKLGWTILIGNHDWHNLDCKDHSLAPLGLLDNVILVDAPHVSGRILMVPYMDDLEKFRAIINDPKYKKQDVLIMHQGVVGFDFGNGHIEEKGLELKELKRFKKVISGHFHKYQDLDNLVFLGTPFSHSQGEANQEKFLGVFNDETLEIELAATPFPKHVTIEINCDVEGSKKRIPVNTEDTVRVILTGSQENINNFNKSEFETVKFIERPSDVVEFTSSLKEEDSNEVKFKKWAEEVKGLDPETIALGLELLREVQ